MPRAAPPATADDGSSTAAAPEPSMTSVSTTTVTDPSSVNTESAGVEDAESSQGGKPTQLESGHDLTAEEEALLLAHPARVSLQQVSDPDAGMGRFSGNEEPPLSCQECARQPSSSASRSQNFARVDARSRCRTQRHGQYRYSTWPTSSNRPHPACATPIAWTEQPPARLDLRGLRGTAPEASLLFSRRFIAASGY